jgi:hypothetical protein
MYLYYIEILSRQVSHFRGLLYTIDPLRKDNVALDAAQQHMEEAVTALINATSCINNARLPEYLKHQEAPNSQKVGS